jgi:hypothetical protein
MSSIIRQIESARFLQECMQIINDLKTAANCKVKGVELGLDANIADDGKTIRELIQIALAKACNFEIPSNIWTEARYKEVCEVARLIGDVQLHEKMRENALKKFKGIDIDRYGG